eukprot:10943556-Alexandrium_andersonii.AAC.1
MKAHSGRASKAEQGRGKDRDEPETGQRVILHEICARAREHARAQVRVRKCASARARVRACARVRVLSLIHI